MFIYHRDLAILLTISNVIVYKMVIDRFNGKGWPLLTANLIAIVLMMQVVTGLMLSYYGLPAFAQPLHILFSFLLFSLQYYLYLLVYRTSTYQSN